MYGPSLLLDYFVGSDLKNGDFSTIKGVLWLHNFIIGIFQKPSLGSEDIVCLQGLQQIEILIRVW